MTNVTHSPNPSLALGPTGTAVATPAAARALLAVLLAPLIALLDAQLTRLFARLEDVMQQWRDGTLPPPPSMPPTSCRRPARAAAPPLPIAPADSWLAELINLALPQERHDSRRAEPDTAAPSAAPCSTHPPKMPYGQPAGQIVRQNQESHGDGEAERRTPLRLSASMWRFLACLRCESRPARQMRLPCTLARPVSPSDQITVKNDYRGIRNFSSFSFRIRVISI